MLTEENKSILIEKSRQAKEECNSIISMLKKIKDEREMHYQKKEGLKKQISSLVSEIKNTKGNNDEFSRMVIELKKERDSYNQKVRALIAKIRELRTSKNKIAKGTFINFEGIKKQIEQLEFSIETNALPYDKEQKINDKIKRLKKVYKENADTAKLDDELKSMSIEIDSAKKTADEFHNKLDEAMKNSKTESSAFMELSRKISLLRRQQNEEFEAFKKLKSEYIDALNKLKEKSADIIKMDSQLYDNRKEKSNIDSSLKKQALQKKVESVKEKLKNEKKLTKEDILILQSEDPL